MSVFLRQFVCVASLFFASQAFATLPISLDLDGPWSAQSDGDASSTPATVPGCIHTDLVTAGKIKDPYFGRNVESEQWVTDRTWVYSRPFDLSAEILQKKHVIVRCDGLDTLATVRVNGQIVGQADNMFRTWTFDAKPFLRAGQNTISVTFAPLNPYIDAFIKAANGPNTATRGMANVRKATYSNGWDFAPKAPTCGIYKPIQLIAYDDARINGVTIDTNVSPNNPATLTIIPYLSDAAPTGTRLRATATLDGASVVSATSDATDASDQVHLTIPNPKLWWPAGMGAHPLYDVAIELLDASGTPLDRTTRRIGLRKLELLHASDGLPLRLRVNGRPMFARGASWVPSDMFLANVTPAKFKQFLDDSAAVNMNMIRSWGGGYYEDDAFYDACDERGILVWMDFKFACNAYPAKNTEFAANVWNEVTDQVLRLGTHPAMAVWCGNNEVTALTERFKVITHEEYDLLFHHIIGTRVKQLLPQANYVGGSPEEGDEHNWWVWHIGAEFEKYRDSHGWMTEFGFQSFPVPATVDGFTAPEDRDTVLSPVMKSHQHNGNKRGNEMILDQMARYFRPAKDFDSTLWLSQINQAYGLTMGIEHWRADWPKSSGAFVWQLDDSWPCASWSMIDYFGRWKAAQYAMRAAYAPVLVTGVYDAKANAFPVQVCSDLPDAFEATVQWRVMTTAGAAVSSGSTNVYVPAGTTSVNGPSIALKDAIDRAGEKNLLLWVDVTKSGQSLASKVTALVRPKELSLQDPKLSADVAADGDSFLITIRAARPALWAWADLAGDPDARFSDNFVPVAGDRPVQIRVTPSKPISIEDLRKQLVLRSLFDTAAIRN